MGRIINTSSTNTRHKHKYKTSEHNNNNNNNNNNKATSSKTKQIQTYHEDYWIDCIYHVASYGFSTFWSVSFPRWTTICCTSWGDRVSGFRWLINRHWSKTRCCDNTWKKACPHSTCGYCCGSTKGFESYKWTGKFTGCKRVGKHASKVPALPILSNGRQGTRGGGSSRKPTGGKPTGRTPTQGGGGEGEEGLAPSLLQASRVP